MMIWNLFVKLLWIGRKNLDNKNILISVILPIYNAQRYLKETIESILNQTHENFEFIILNDG